MKKILQLNSVCNGSTGKIMKEIQIEANKNNFMTLSICGRRNPFSELNSKKIGSRIDFFFHVLFTFIFNNHGMYSKIYTKKIIKEIKKYDPDIIQLHNIHGYYLNYKLLFKYLKNDFTGKVFWTFHDCWPFTGHCAYFDYVNCDKWKTKCKNCVQIKKYPYSLFFDTSKKEYERKKETFNGVKNLTIITPSKWLASLIKSSYLKYPVKVINNGIDLNTFKEIKSNDILKKYNIPVNKKIVLGVANVWEDRKGLSDFILLSNLIKKDTIIVLVGLTKKQIKKLPKNIIGVERTDNQLDLVKLYSKADLFLNPTKEDNYPTVNIEAIACGTPIITYNTGGCSEQVFKNTGFCVNSFDELVDKTKYCLDNNYKEKIFSNKSSLKKIDSKVKFKEYIKLYKES